MSIVDCGSLLLSSKAPERLKAAVYIGKNSRCEFGPQLMSAFLKERLKATSWKNQYEMLVALGRIRFTEATEQIRQIVDANIPHDMVTTAAAEAYVRIERKDLGDAKPVLDLLAKGRYAVICGALKPLGYDRMVPPDDQIERILDFCWDLHLHPDMLPQLSDARHPVAAACAGWSNPRSKKFLEHCLATCGRYASLESVAEDSLKGKYSKLV